MRNWNNFILEKYGATPTKLKNMNAYVDSVLSELGVTRDEFEKQRQHYIDRIDDRIIDDVHVININDLSNYVISGTSQSNKKVVKREIKNIVDSYKRYLLSNDKKDEFLTILNELTDFDKLYPYNYFESDDSPIKIWKFDRGFDIRFEPINELDLLELSKLTQKIGYALSKQSYF